MTECGGMHHPWDAAVLHCQVFVYLLKALWRSDTIPVNSDDNNRLMYFHGVFSPFVACQSQRLRFHPNAFAVNE